MGSGRVPVNAWCSLLFPDVGQTGNYRHVDIGNVTALRAWLGALAAMLLLTLAVTGAPAWAQDLPSLPVTEAGGVTEAGTEKLQSLVDLLEDDTRRAAFVANLEALIAAQSETEETQPTGIGQNLTQQLSQAVDEISKRTIGGGVTP